MKLISTVFLILSFSLALFSQESIDTLKTVERFKKMYSDLDYVYKFFEEDTMKQYYGMTSVSSKEWDRNFTSADSKSIADKIKANIHIALNQENKSLSFSGKNNSKTQEYQFLEVKFSVDESIPGNYVGVHFKPTELKIGGKQIALYPEDRSLRLNESGRINQSGNFSQRIPFAMLKSETLKGAIELKGTLELELTSNMQRLDLQVGKKMSTANGTDFHLLKINEGRAFIRTTNKQSKEKVEMMCMDEEGLKVCGLRFYIPYKIYEYASKGKANYSEEAYKKVLDSVSFKTLEEEEWMMLIDSRLFLNKLVVFSPGGLIKYDETVTLKL